MTASKSIMDKIDFCFINQQKKKTIELINKILKNFIKKYTHNEKVHNES